MSKTSPKSLSREVVKEAVEKLYGITSIKPIELQGEGIENAAWVFYTESQNYIVKIFDYTEIIEKDVNEEVLLYEYLREHNINVSEVIPSLSNQKVVSIDKFPAILMKYEKLTRYKPHELSKKQLESIARTIGHMHHILMTYPRKEYIHVAKQDAMSIYDHSLKDFDLFLKSPNAKSPHLQDHDRLRKVRENAIKYLQSQKLEKELTKSVLHNDLALGHILFLSNGKPYIFDFSDFAYGAVALELGVLFFNFYREGGITTNEWKSMIKEFLDVYTKIIPLTENDMKAIDIFTVSRMLEHIRYLDEKSIEEGYPVDDKGIKKRYDLLEYLYLDQSN